MDEIKDTRNRDDISRFVQEQNLRTDPFGRNRAAERLYKRVERVNIALYLLTRHVPIEEPLREKIRSAATGLFAQILELKDAMRAPESAISEGFESTIRNLISLVRMLTAGGFISFQNAEVVSSALDELGGFLSSSQRSEFAEMFSFSREELMGDTSPLGGAFIRDIKDIRSVKDTNIMSDISRTDTSAARAQAIVSALQSEGVLGIKDICARLPDYSEKMIQRELAALVASGKVKKIGLKRWSKYTRA